MTEKELQLKRERKRIRRNRKIQNRLKAYGSKSIPMWAKNKVKIKAVEEKIEQKSIWRRLLDWTRKWL